MSRAYWRFPSSRQVNDVSFLFVNAHSSFEFGPNPDTLCFAEQYPKAMGKTVAEINLAGIEPAPFEKLKFSMMTPEVTAHLREKCPDVKSVALFGIEVRPIAFL
jgi:hypothetical protein